MKGIKNNFLTNIALVKDKVVDKTKDKLSGIKLLAKDREVVSLPNESPMECDEYELEEEEKENGGKMLQVMDWAFEKATGNVPGFGTAEEMANKYLKKYGSVSEAIKHLTRWQVTSAATAGFVTNLGGLPAMPFTLPANIAGVMAIQLRMIGAIAVLGGSTENTEEKKTGMYLCLLGSQAGDVLSKTATQFAVKFSTASLKKLSGTVLTKINQRVGFRLFTKFGKSGIVNIHKAIPILGGFVGGTIDAFSTYAIAKAASAMFLDEIIDFEKQEKIEVEKVRLMINMALVDGEFTEQEKLTLKALASHLSISQKSIQILDDEIEHPKLRKVDLTYFKSDALNAISLMSVLHRVACVDGPLDMSEILYFKTLCKELEYDDAFVADILNYQPMEQN